VAIDEERLYFLANVICAPAIPDAHLGQWYPRPAPQDRGNRVEPRRAMHPSNDPIRPDLHLDAGCLGVQPTCHVASRPGCDHRTELVERDFELGHRDHLAVAKVLESSVSEVQLRGAIELVRQASLAELDLAVHAPVGSIGVKFHHAAFYWSIGRGTLEAAQAEYYAAARSAGLALEREHDPRIGLALASIPIAPSGTAMASGFLVAGPLHGVVAQSESGLV
jgi:hypothetical protein